MKIQMDGGKNMSMMHQGTEYIMNIQMESGKNGNMTQQGKYYIMKIQKEYVTKIKGEFNNGSKGNKKNV
jgi:hypothetical protein